MKDIKPFIDLGFHTVPLRGELVRTEDGTKTVPVFEKAWKERYSKHLNLEITALGGAMTGHVSNIVAIDCDSQATFDLFMASCPDYKFTFISEGKPQGGGTIIFLYSADLPIPTFSIHDSTISIDFYSDKGFVYLPTDANKTKVRWPQESRTELPKIIAMPAGVETLLTCLHKQFALSKQVVNKTNATPVVESYNYLQPQVELLIKRGFSPSLFKIITPKDFRDTPEYVKTGYLHPKDVPDSRGSEYLVRVSAILGADPSIDSGLYYSAMRTINDLWSTPMDLRRMEATIIIPMMEGNAMVDGEVIWKYDENWRDQGLSFVNKLGEAIETFFDDIKNIYYLINYTRGTVTAFSRDNDIFSYMETVGNGMSARKDLKNLMPVVRTSVLPSVNFGFYTESEYDKKFNLFNQTPALAILSNPESYASQYVKPTTMLKYLDSLIPDAEIRDYVLKFLKRKLSTFLYSPIILYFLGVPGSGKDTFIEVLSKIMGEGYIAKPSVGEFLDKYNGWLLDTYFVQLDEYANELSKVSEKTAALGKILQISGKSDIQIRRMQKDGYQYKHSATLVMTDNRNALPIQEEDRRLVLIDAPNKLATMDWVVKEGGISAVHDRILDEVNAFCYYLATSVGEIGTAEYQTPPVNAVKKGLISARLAAGPKIAYLLSNSLFSELEEIAYENNIDGVFSNSSNGYIIEEDLWDLYLAMTEGNGNRRALSKMMDEVGFRKMPTTRKNARVYTYTIPGLLHYTPMNFEAR